MVDLAEVVQDLNAISSIAVVLGVVFVVFQLRQNAREMKQHVEEVRAQTFLNIIEYEREIRFSSGMDVVRGL